jgi:type IV secretion system protein TrbB
MSPGRNLPPHACHGRAAPALAAILTDANCAAARQEGPADKPPSRTRRMASLPAEITETAARCTAMLGTAFTGAVRDALADPATLEIMANPDGSVWIERAGAGVTRAPHHLSADDRERVIRLVASATSAQLDPDAPIVSAELPGSGERFEGLLPPISAGPCFSIRKPAAALYTLDDYVAGGTLSPAIAAALRAAIAARENILIAGATSSGKTTFANALLAEPAFQCDRIVILEDTRELVCAAPNTVQLRTRANALSLQQLVRSTLRLRPDRIVVGEVRGPEALDLLKAWNTGHPGGITTLHADSALGALTRLEQLVLEASPCPPGDLIAGAIGIALFMSRDGGVRRVTEALRIRSFDGETYQTEPLVSRALTLVAEGHHP